MSLVTYRPRRFATPSAFNDAFVRNFFNAEWPDARRDSTYVPAVNIKETDTAYSLTFAVPGRKKEDLKVNVERNILTVSYQTEAKTDKEEGKHHVREFVQKSFSRSFQLPESVNTDSISAEYTDGMLTVTLPKSEIAPQHTREISIA